MLVVIPTLLAGVGLLGAFSGFPLGPRWGEALLVLVLSMIGSYGLAFLLFGLTLRFKDADSLIGLVGNAAPLLGGVFFPVTLLPEPLRSLALVFPFTYGVDALRGLWFGTPTLFPALTQYALLGALGLGYLGLGWWALGHFERRGRLAGMEGF
ncbi:MAG: ABC transporter permease, partial [Candidatus Bipolaricaulota bacterium]